MPEAYLDSAYFLFRWTKTGRGLGVCSRTPWRDNYFKISEGNLQWFDREEVPESRRAPGAPPPLPPMLESEMSLVGKKVIDKQNGSFKIGKYTFVARDDATTTAHDKVAAFVAAIHQAQRPPARPETATSFTSIGDQLQGAALVRVGRTWEAVHLTLRPIFNAGGGQGMGEIVIEAREDVHRRDDQAALVLRTGSRTFKHLGGVLQDGGSRKKPHPSFEVEVWRESAEAPSEMVPKRLRPIAAMRTVVLDVSADARNRDIIGDFMSTHMRFVVPRSFMADGGVLQNVYHFEPLRSNEVLCHWLEWSSNTLGDSAMRHAWVLLAQVKVEGGVYQFAGDSSAPSTAMAANGQSMSPFPGSPMALNGGGGAALNGGGGSPAMPGVGSPAMPGVGSPGFPMAGLGAPPAASASSETLFGISVYPFLDAPPHELWSVQGGRGLRSRRPQGQNGHGGAAEGSDEPVNAPSRILVLDEHTEVTAIWYPRRVIEIVRLVDPMLDASNGGTRQASTRHRPPPQRMQKLTLRAPSIAQHEMWLSGLIEVSKRQRMLDADNQPHGTAALTPMRNGMPIAMPIAAFASGAVSLSAVAPVVAASPYTGAAAPASAPTGAPASTLQLVLPSAATSMPAAMPLSVGAPPLGSSLIVGESALLPPGQAAPLVSMPAAAAYSRPLDSSIAETADVRRALDSLRECLKLFLVQPGIRTEVYDVLQKALFCVHAESVLIQRLTLAFLKLTAELVPGGRHEARVPKMQHGQNPRWMRYTEAYAMWLLTFVNARVPMAVHRFPEPPLARVRAVFLCCDLSAALLPFFKHLRQEAKTKRLQDLVSAMLLWTSATSADPTRELYDKLAYPGAGTSPDLVAGFLRDQPSKRIDQFLQLRLLLDPRYTGQAMVAQLGDLNPSGIDVDSMDDTYSLQPLTARGQAQLRARAALLGTEHAKVMRLAGVARAKARATGFGGDEQTVSFLPFDKRVEVIRGVGYWPLQMLRDPKSRAALFLEFVKLGIYSEHQRNAFQQKRLAKDSFEQLSVTQGGPAAGGAAEAAGTAPAQQIYPPWEMACAVLENALFGRALVTLDTLDGLPATIEEQRAHVYRIKTSDRENRKTVVEVWTSVLVGRCLAEEQLTRQSNSPLLQRIYEVLELMCIGFLRPGAVVGFVLAMKGFPRDQQVMLLTLFFFNHLKPRLEANVRDDLAKLADGFVHFKRMVDSLGAGRLLREQVPEHDGEWGRLRASIGAAGRAAFERTAEVEGLAILGLFGLLVEVNDQQLISTVMGHIVNLRPLFSLGASDAAITLTPRGSGAPSITRSLSNAVGSAISVATGGAMTPRGATLTPRGGRRVLVGVGASPARQYLQAIIDALFGKGELSDMAGDGVDEAFFHPAFREQMPRILMEFRQQLWKRDVLCLYTPAAFDDSDEAQQAVRGAIHTLLVNGSASMCLVYTRQIWSIGNSMRTHAFSKDDVNRQMINVLQALFEFETHSNEGSVYSGARAHVRRASLDEIDDDTAEAGNAVDEDNSIPRHEPERRKRWEILRDIILAIESQHGSQATLIKTLVARLEQLQQAFDAHESHASRTQATVEELRSQMESELTRPGPPGLTRMVSHGRGNLLDDDFMGETLIDSDDEEDDEGEEGEEGDLEGGAGDDADASGNSLTRRGSVAGRRGSLASNVVVPPINPKWCVEHIVAAQCLHEFEDHAASYKAFKLANPNDVPADDVPATGAGSWIGVSGPSISQSEVDELSKLAVGLLKLANRRDGGTAEPIFLSIFGRLAPTIFGSYWFLQPAQISRVGQNTTMAASPQRKAAIARMFAPSSRTQRRSTSAASHAENNLFSFDRKFKAELETSDDLVATQHFWVVHTAKILSKESVRGKYVQLNEKDGGTFFLRLFKVLFKLERLHYDSMTRQAAFSSDPVPDNVVRSTIPVMDYFETYSKALRFLRDVLPGVVARLARADWRESFDTFRADDMKTVAENGVDVADRVSSPEMALAKRALDNRFNDYLQNRPPSQWSRLFKETSKMAYNLQYMFREDVGIATQRFRDALHACPAFTTGSFGVERNMFEELLETSLQMYGDNGLVDQQALATTNFTTNPEELVRTVREGVRTKSAEVKLLGELTANWMEMQIIEKKMPLTPHHTQVLAMLMFSQFYQNQATFSKPTNEGGYNYNAAIMQMKTGEGKSIVIAMLAIFVVKHLRKRVHVLENNEGLKIRDFETYKPFYDRFNVSAAMQIDATSDVCYCLKKENNKFFNIHLSDGSLDLSGIVLIVDEVDDLVVSESPSVSYLKPDAEKTPDYRRCYEALMAGGEKPSDIKPAVWKDCVRIKNEADSKKENLDYVKGPDSWLMTEKLADGTWRVPKVALTDDWLEYLNFKQPFGIPPKKQTFFASLCTPYMYTKYACIFGLTGSVGGESERAYIKYTYRAIAYEVPQFLNTCKNTNKVDAKNLGVTIKDNAAEQETAIVLQVEKFYRKVPVLVIARDPVEMRRLYTRLRKLLVEPANSDMEPEHLQKLQERNEDGVLLRDTWNAVISGATQRHGTGSHSYCCVTVTDYFGGRGHDFQVMDEIANSNGGMLVITTTIPDTREWIQWKGRTARQDRPGQFAVVLSKTDPPFTNNGVLNKNFLREWQKLDADSRIYGDRDGLLRKKDVYIREMLDTYSSDQAKGAWLNELSEKYYKRFPRTLNVQWPRDERDKKFRDMLSRGYKNGADIQAKAQATLDIALSGPPPEWNYPPTKEFVGGAGVGGGINCLFVIDCSFSMDEVEGYDSRMSSQDQTDQRELQRRLDVAGAELGALTFSLMWNNTDDLDIHVKTTAGEEIYYNHRRSRCGGMLDVDMNAGSNKTSVPCENIFWQDAPHGRYEIWIVNINKRDTEYVVRVKQKGEMIFYRGRTNQSGNTRGPSYFLDYSGGLPVTTRLTTSTDCINSIIDNQLKDEDQVGLISFATDIKTELALTEKKGKAATLHGAVNRLKTRGKTMCYGAILKACETLRAHRNDGPKWVVALTDGADTNSKPNDITKAEAVLRDTPNLNLALITLGDEVDMAVVNRLKNAAIGGSEPNTGLHMAADNLETVIKAFEAVAETMVSTAGAAG